MSDKKYETRTIEYFPGAKRDHKSRKTLEALLAEGWEVVSEKHRFGAVSTATLRRVAPEAPPMAELPKSWAEFKDAFRRPKKAEDPAPVEPARPVSLPAPSGPPAGWYVDPESGEGQRWWDGSAWSEHRQA